MNIIVGDNEAGKSTLLEAVALALSGRVDGRWASEELNPYWFNLNDVHDYFAKYAEDPSTPPPSICIELFLDSEDSDVQRMRGVHNSLGWDCPGVKLEVLYNADYAEEFSTYMADPGRPDVLPVEYFDVSWKDFNNVPLRRRPSALGLSVIDSRTLRSRAGVDYHTREILASYLDARERATISVAHRKSRHELTNSALCDLNDRVREGFADIHDSSLGVAMDQSARASWESGIVPHVGDIPFGMSGQGQQASIKVALAMKRKAHQVNTVLIEEPENHLSYGRLRNLLDRIEGLAGDNQQVFVTTHSSFVLNRLGLDKLICLNGDNALRLTALKADSVSYFKHLSGYDTLRLVLARRLVVVEGPSDEMVFNKAYFDHQNRYPMSDGIDVVAMNGLSFARVFELCSKLDRDVVALQDNDGKDESDILRDLDAYLSEKRHMYVGDSASGDTLEPQLMSANGETRMREILRLRTQDSPDTWMRNHKTEASLRILEWRAKVEMPSYIEKAIESVS